VTLWHFGWSIGLRLAFSGGDVLYIESWMGSERNKRRVNRGGVNSGDS